MMLDTETLLSGSDIKTIRDDSRNACYTGYGRKCIVRQSARLLVMLHTLPRLDKTLFVLVSIYLVHDSMKTNMSRHLSLI